MMASKIVFSLSVLPLAAVAFDCSFSSSYPRQYVAPLSPSEFVLDGDVFNPSKPYASAPWSDLFVDITGNASLAPRYKTKMKLTYTSDYLYVAAFVQELQVWANLTADNVVIYNDNDFEVFVSPTQPTPTTVTPNPKILTPTTTTTTTTKAHLPPPPLSLASLRSNRRSIPQQRLTPTRRPR